MSTDPKPANELLVCDLGFAQNELLQPKLHKFTLTRDDERQGHLHVEFDRSTPTLRLRASKSFMKSRVRDLDGGIEKWGGQLREFLVGGNRDNVEFEDSDFYFRYGNGGTLPVVRIESTEYYCLFWRDVDPVGWNIANGASDTLEELLDPSLTIERELREELVIVDPERHRWYGFESRDDRVTEHADFITARRQWTERFHKLGYGDLVPTRIPLKWLPGPDSVHVCFGEERKVFEQGGFVLNINAEDLGIEVDRVAKLSVDSTARFCDGEIIEGKLMNRVIGLFEVQRFNDRLSNVPRPQFPDPDLLFHSGAKHPPEILEQRTRDFLKEVSVFAGHSATLSPAAESEKFRLCPVTETIIKRTVKLTSTGTGSERPSNSGAPSECQLFVSCASEDEPLGRRIYEHLERRGWVPFLSSETLQRTDLARGIDDALDAASWVIVAGTRLENITKDWVDYEWRSCHFDILSGKTKCDLVSIVEGVDPLDLPRPLRVRKAIVVKQGDVGGALGQLERLLGDPPVTA